MSYDPFATGVLDPSVHHRLLEDAPRILRVAGLSPSHVKGLWTPLINTCGDVEVKWMTNFSSNVEEGIAGLSFAGAYKPFVEDRIIALTCCLLRNHIDARIETLREVISNEPDPTVLLVPNFHTKDRLRPWELGILTDLMIDRYKSGLQTVVAMPSWMDMEAEYGDLVDLIHRHYTSVTT